MQLSGFGLLALSAISAVSAFRDTSPFFFFSTHDFEQATSQQLQSATSVLDDVTNKLRSCPSDFYILVSQPGVHAMDYGTKRSAPRLREQVLKKDKAVQSSLAVSELVGEVDISQLSSTLESNCGAGVIEVDTSSDSLPSSSSYESRPQIIKIDFSRLPGDSSRVEKLASNDAFLASLVDLLPTQKYTVIYTTTPRGDGEFISVEDEPSLSSHHGALHIQQRRNAHLHTHATRDDDKDHGNSKDLFEKYQFLSPGIFMGLIAGLLFTIILYFGYSTLGSLQVSYASFAKESGPGTAKKQQ